MNVIKKVTDKNKPKLSEVTEDINQCIHACLETGYPQQFELTTNKGTVVMVCVKISENL